MTRAYTVTPSYDGQFAFIERETLTDGSYVFNVIVTDDAGNRNSGVQMNCSSGQAAIDLLNVINGNSTNVIVLQAGDATIPPRD